MALFKKRETLIQNIAYMAIMAAINVIFVLLTAILPPMMFLIIFVLPLTSAIVTVFCKKRYFPIYFIVTISLCLLTTSGIYIYDTFFYVLPSLITGFLFGFLVEKRVSGIYIIFFSSILQYAITYLTFIVLNAIIPEMNFIDTLLNIFGLGNFVFKEVFAHIFILTLATIQTIFTYVFLKMEVRKLGLSINLDVNQKYILNIINLVTIILSIIFLFIYVPLTFVFVLINFIITAYQMVELLLYKKTLIYILLGASLAITVFIFGLCYNLLPHPSGVILLTPFIGQISLIYLFNNLCINKNEKNVE